MVAITCLVYEYGACVTTTWAIVSDVDVIVGAGSGQRPDLPGCCACLATHPCRHRSEMLLGVSRAVSEVVRWRMVLGVVIGHICGSFLPVKAKLILCRTTAEPVKVHPNHFYSSLDDGVRDEAGCSRIVGLDG